MAPNTNITMVVTSCDRHDLLKKTLESFYQTTDVEPQVLIVIEDSNAPMPDFLKDFVWRQRNLIWLTNETRCGQIYSIDRAYAEVKTDYIFHCEDDWEFVLRDNWMRESKEILDKYPTILQVSLRGDTGWHQLINWPPYPFKIAMPGWHGHWGGISFNPGLRRTADYKKIGSYGRHVAYGTHGLGHEVQLSRKLLDEGYRIADLNRTIVVHTGGSRSRAIEPLPLMPKLLIAIPACHKFEYGRWESEQSPHYDPATAWEGRPYGTDIHISGKNDRIDAVRETWAKDIEPFKEHITLKFFYGEPHHRQPLSDEVFLQGVGDDYAALPLKTIAIAKYVVENGYDFVFKGDDDTAVYIDKLVRELIENRFDYAGYCNGNVCSGGPGYFLSRRACAILAAQGGSPDHWAEDVWTSKVLGHNRITPYILGGHRPGFVAHWFFGDTFDPSKLADDIVTMHAVQPEVMRAWHEYTWGKK
jgi:hypothetical protein